MYLLKFLIGEIVETNSPSKGRRGSRPSLSRISSVPSISVIRRINSVMAKNEDFYGNTKNVIYSPGRFFYN